MQQTTFSLLENLFGNGCGSLTSWLHDRIVGIIKKQQLCSVLNKSETNFEFKIRSENLHSKPEKHAVLRINRLVNEF
jgi:hypothetical protein